MVQCFVFVFKKSDSCLASIRVRLDVLFQLPDNIYIYICIYGSRLKIFRFKQSRPHSRADLPWLRIGLHPSCACTAAIVQHLAGRAAPRCSVLELGGPSRSLIVVLPLSGKGLSGENCELH